MKAFRNDQELISLFLNRYQFDSRPWPSKPEKADPEKYSNFDFYPVLAALHSGRKVVGVDIPFSYPVKQKTMEEALAGNFIAKRREQRETILAEVMQFARYLVDSNDPRVHLVKQPS